MTTIILFIVALSILIYISYLQGWIHIGIQSQVTLTDQATIIPLDMKEKSYIDVNSEQIFKVTADGINAYAFDGEEIWSDTFSINDVVVKKRTPYIAVGGEKGKSILVFDQKGRQTEINTNHPIIYFSINEKGSVVVIEEGDRSHTVTVYDKHGTRVCYRTTHISADGYPMVAEISPDDEWLLISYVNVNNPQIVSTIYGVNTTDNQTDKLDNTRYGISQSGNLVYAIEFINENTWISIGDKAFKWYDLKGNEKASKTEIVCVFVPYITKMSKYGGGYLPIVTTQKPADHIIHRQDQLVYLNDKAEETVNIPLDTGVDSLYEDENGVVLKYDGIFKGYDRLGNELFEYKPMIDVSKVIYNPKTKKGIAINKEKIILLTPKKEGKTE